MEKRHDPVIALMDTYYIEQTKIVHQNIIINRERGTLRKTTTTKNPSLYLRHNKGQRVLL